MRLIITGSAPIGNVLRCARDAAAERALDSDVLKFLRVAFSCTVLEGYGQTECCAAATLTSPQEFVYVRSQDSHAKGTH